ncbi:uncharacterized protein LOC129949013 [Eupeodes corollae]|uniref:uncharacterized protein LOC129949013 n=1 Tax=Eupeodes corollae TaxID=290404 RepID=UPI00249015CC|nr:uncharacterized protein LOC129949013 [Eupeodes corollae]
MRISVSAPAVGLLSILFVLSITSSGNASNILCLFTSPGRSHIIIYMAIARTLVERGHNVTIVTTMPLKDKNPKYHHIFLPPAEEDYAEYYRLLSVAATESNIWGAYNRLFWANVERVRIQDKAFKSPRFQDFLNNTGNHFDAVILGWVFNTYQLGVAAHFKCPVMLAFVNHPTKLLLSMAGSPLALSTVPLFGNSYDMLNFKKRLSNYFDYLLWNFFEEFGEYKMSQYYEEYFSSEKYPSYDEMKRNVSLVFCASHFSEGRIRPHPPGFIEIGGIQVKDKANPLPQEVDEFLKTANEGFILFSLGTNVKSSDISSNTTSAIFKVLSQSKYKVLWKWDSAEMPGESTNIMFRKWFPQDDLLAHPQLKLFITHAGKGSSVEAQYHGVPMLAIPVYGDQFGNAEEMRTMGYGLIVNHRNVTEQSFRRDFAEILKNPKYLKAVTKFSKLYTDRPLSPRESVIYWTEYVIRHRGAKHMQSPVIHMNFFQKNSLDVIVFIGVILYLSFVIMRKMFKIFYRTIFMVCSRESCSKVSIMRSNFKFVTLLCLLVAFLVGGSESANILGVFTSSSPSHQIVHMSYIKALIERGHNVTVLSTIPLKDKNPKYHHLLIPPSAERVKEMDDMKSAMNKPQGFMKSITGGINSVLSIIGYFFNDFHVGLGAHFRCPIIMSWTSSSYDMVDKFVGNPPEIAYVPASTMFGMVDTTKFTGRLSNLFQKMVFKIFGALIDNRMANLYSEIFPSTDYPSFEDAKKKVSLLLLNYHFSDGIIRPNVPAVIECGGIQIKEKPDPLPEDLQKIFNASSEHGVIYLSFGSNIKGDDLNPELFGILFKALSSLKQTVLWKWDGKKLPGESPNIHYRKWLPQDDLLAHPNVKAFITHAGKGSTAESQFHGVPMVTVPMFADQLGNADQVKNSGFGVKVDQKTMTVESLKAAILEVLENPKYKENINEFSKLYRDRPMSAKETAVFWIEYVIRHKGAYHMQSPAVFLNSFQLFSVDVIGFLLLVAFVVYKLITVPAKFAIRKFFAWKYAKAQKVKKQ